ncbi:hypothetical protein EYF80_066842 [Liparis tanakae]
MHCAL